MSGETTFRQGDIWWADLPAPRGSEPGYPRPVLIVQQDAFNRSRIQTIVCVLLASNVRLAAAPGNLLLDEADTGLPKPSVANVSQIITVDKHFLTEYVSTVAEPLLDSVLDGIFLVLGR